MRTLLIFLIGGILGLAAGAGGMLIAFPFLFPPPEVNETVDTMEEQAELIAAARFREGVPGQDIVHWGRGGLKLYRTANGEVLLELQADFEVGAGPDYWIYLNTRKDIDDENGFLADSGRVRLTRLKSFTGSQVYRLTAGQFAAIKAVTVWCETFGEYIASANLAGTP